MSIMSSSAGEEAETFQLQRLQLLPVEGNNLQSGAISTVAFDTHQELLWVGNDCVRNLSVIRDHRYSLNPRSI